jgi:ferredoxin
MYRIEIDRSECIGYGLCAQTAPRSLLLDADGLAKAVAETVDDEDVLEAALVCPMGAIAADRVDDRRAA